MGRRPARERRRSSVSVSMSVSASHTPQSRIINSPREGAGADGGENYGARNANHRGNGSRVSASIGAARGGPRVEAVNHDVDDDDDAGNHHSQPSDLRRSQLGGPRKTLTLDHAESHAIPSISTLANPSPSSSRSASQLAGKGAGAAAGSTSTTTNAAEAMNVAAENSHGYADIHTNMDSTFLLNGSIDQLGLPINQMGMSHDLDCNLNQNHSWDNLDLAMPSSASSVPATTESDGPYRTVHSHPKNNPLLTPTPDSNFFSGDDFQNMIDWDIETEFFQSCDRRDVQISPISPQDETQNILNPLQKLAELNAGLQKLVVMSEKGGSWQTRENSISPSDGGNRECIATESRLINDVLKAAQTLLDILRIFQPPSSNRCSACKRGHPDRDRSSDRPWPNTQTLLSMISCYVQLLRLCSNFVVHVLETLSMHSVGNCIGLDHLSLVTDQQIRSLGFPIRLSTELQLTLLVQIIVHLLDSIERALGCNSTTSSNCGSPVSIDSSKHTSEEHTLQHHKCNVCSSHPATTQKTSHKSDYLDDAGLLGRCRSRELLEMVIKHEDMESQSDGKRSIRLLREDINRIKEMV